MYARRLRPGSRVERDGAATSRKGITANKPRRCDRIGTGFHHLIANCVTGYLPLGQPFGQGRKVTVGQNCFGVQNEFRRDVSLECIAQESHALQDKNCAPANEHARRARERASLTFSLERLVIIFGAGPLSASHPLPALLQAPGTKVLTGALTGSSSGRLNLLSASVANAPGGSVKAHASGLSPGELIVILNHVGDDVSWGIGAKGVAL